ncbi:P1 family peptidase [Halalkalibacillus halophilus]|uniref:DmpA family aminopeptidase n=1 Tax=Halalkalibacillus halophilus TaxID=392827 RepID=UPI000422B45C|nr:P1 family peptidase [Halalkalibacillus halophilus]
MLKKDCIQIGSFKRGKHNKITDVHGVTVGNVTLNDGEVQTGVTAIKPHQGNIFKEKVIASSHVFNGFGKTTGLIQIDELGTLETPIILTNTLSVGDCYRGLTTYMLHSNPEIGETTGTVNPVVAECNDMSLNNIRKMNIKSDHVIEALYNASADFEEGSVGAGRGMKCFDLKGGVGSSSRIVSYSHGDYTIGILTLTNFGKLSSFVMNGDPIGERLKKSLEILESESEQGSIIMVVATDLPVTQSQLNRIIKRTGVGLSRTGSFLGNGSGDLAIGFSTANKGKGEEEGLNILHSIPEADLDQAFEATVEATEEAILHSMQLAETVTGKGGRTLYNLQEVVDKTE